jgi:hypothetical protein
MGSPLTGDFEAVLEISVETVNRLLAGLHQNAFNKAELPSFPHSLIERIGDTYSLDGVRGTVYAQVGSPHIELIDGSTDRFWLEVDVRAWFRADTGSEPFPAFINGRVRARYRIQDIDPNCTSWKEVADEYLWIRVDPDTVTFRGTAEDDETFSDLTVINPQPADDPVPAVTRQLAYQLATRFEATPHKVDPGFRRGRMRSLAPTVIVPVSLSGGLPVGDIASVNNSVLSGFDFAIRVDREYIMSHARKALADIRDQINTMPSVPTTASGPFGSFDTVYRVYANNDFAASWQASGPSTSIRLTGSGGATTESVLPNVTFDVEQFLDLGFDSSTETLTLTVGKRFVTALEDVGPAVHDVVQSVASNACVDVAPRVNSAMSRKQDMIEQLKTLDDEADATIDGAEFLDDGIILRGTVWLARRARPVLSFDTLPSGSGFSALLSWIPGGHIDSFEWSWTWVGENQPAGSARWRDRFIFRRPRGRPSRWGLTTADERLPGLDGMGRVCLTIRGRQVDSVTGVLKPVQVVAYCRRYGLPLSKYPSGRGLLKNVPELSEDVPFPQLSVVDAIAVEAPAPNTLVVYADEKFDGEIVDVVGAALDLCGREDAGLVFLMLFREDSVGVREMRSAMQGMRDLTARTGLAAMVNEDVQGTWAQALSMGAGSNEMAWRLLSPRGGVTWMHEGRVDVESLGKALDACLMPAPVPRPAPIRRAVPIGARLPIGAMTIGPRRSERWESNCPPVNLSRATRGGTKLVLVQRNSEASERLLNELSVGTSIEGPPRVVVVVDGADEQEADSMRDYLGLRFTTVGDPTGAVSDRLGVGIWPAVLTIGPDGVVRGIEHRGAELTVVTEHKAVAE